MAADPGVAEHFAEAGQQRDAALLGMWVFLVTEVLFFGVLFGGYTVARLLNYDGFVTGSDHTDVVLGTVNTAVLLTSSLTMALAVRAAALDRRRAASLFLALTLLLGLAFLGVKVVEYQAEIAAGLVPWADFGYDGPHAQGVRLFFYLYFVMTGMHALHLVIGVGLVAVMLVQNARGRFGADYHTPLEVTGLYWHFVDVVWVFLYPLIYLVAPT